MKKECKSQSLDYLKDYLENKLARYNFAHDIALKLVYDVNYRAALTTQFSFHMLRPVLHEMGASKEDIMQFPQTGLRVDGLFLPAFDIPRSPLYRWIKGRKD